MKGSVQATIIATDFANSLSLKAPTIEVPKSKITVSNGFNLDAPKFAPPPPPPVPPAPTAKKDDKGNAAGPFAIPSFSLFRPKNNDDNKK